MQIILQLDNNSWAASCSLQHAMLRPWKTSYFNIAIDCFVLFTEVYVRNQQVQVGGKALSLLFWI